jgi:predicted MFS family arabinose efflux permease
MTILAFFMLKESLPQELSSKESSATKVKTGYGKILKDRFFVTFLVGDTLVKMAMVMMFVLLSVYVKENFGILENKYGLIMTVNAVLAASLQYPATSITRRFRPTRMLALGALFYALGLGSVAFGSKFFHFVISMVILTIGELILMPIAVNLVSELAPADQRGRYMSLYSLTMGAAKGVGPVMGGLLNDHIAPVAIWYGGFVMGLFSAAAFLVLGRQRAQQKEMIET